MNLFIDLSARHVCLGSTVRLSEWISPLYPEGVRSVGHTAVKIREYNSTIREFSMIEEDRYIITNPDVEFDNLPEREAGYPRIAYADSESNRNIITYDFRPVRLGVYMISAAWMVSRLPTEFISAPVILVVTPPMLENGFFADCDDASC